MRTFRRWSQVLVALAIVAALGIGMMALFAPVAGAKGGRCICPLIYAPVVCRGGKVF